MTLWKVTCLEDEFPGMWQRWYRHQSVGIGWPPQDGFRLIGDSPGGRGWNKARAAMKAIEIGDQIVVALWGHRVGRLGYVTGKAIEDDEWAPLVPEGRGYPHGEMGRRILVRWDLTVGPDSRDMVVHLPQDAQFTLGELRPTIARVQSLSPSALTAAMNDPANWVGLLTHFDYERALSGYIAAYRGQACIIALSKPAVHSNSIKPGRLKSRPRSKGGHPPCPVNSTWALGMR